MKLSSIIAFGFAIFLSIPSFAMKRSYAGGGPAPSEASSDALDSSSEDEVTPFYSDDESLRRSASLQGVRKVARVRTQRDDLEMQVGNKEAPMATRLRALLDLSAHLNERSLAPEKSEAFWYFVDTHISEVSPLDQILPQMNDAISAGSFTEEERLYLTRCSLVLARPNFLFEKEIRVDVRLENSDPRVVSDKLSYFTFLSASDARLHYLNMVSDFPAQSGFFNDKVLSRTPTRHGQSFNELSLQRLAESVRGHLEAGKRVFTAILGDDSHFVALGIDDQGRVAIVDSLYPVFLQDQEKVLLREALNGAHIQVSGKKVHFGKVEEIRTGQQRADNSCLIFSILNARQMAKVQSIDGYQEVTASLSSGAIQRYEDFRNIGQHGRLSPLERPHPNAHLAFVRSFRVRTVQMIRGLL